MRGGLMGACLFFLGACEASAPAGAADAGADAAAPTLANEQCDGEDEDLDGRVDEAAGCYVPVYRWIWSNFRDHQDFVYVTSGSPEPPPDLDCRAGFRCTFQGERFVVYRVAVPGTVPLHVLYEEHRLHHLLTVDDDERASLVAQGATDEGVLGYVLPRDAAERADAIPLWRRHNSTVTSTLFTAEESELSPDAFVTTEVQPDCCRVWPIGTR